MLQRCGIAVDWRRVSADILQRKHTDGWTSTASPPSRGADAARDRIRALEEDEHVTAAFPPLPRRRFMNRLIPLLLLLSIAIGPAQSPTPVPKPKRDARTLRVLPLGEPPSPTEEAHP